MPSIPQWRPVHGLEFSTGHLIFFAYIVLGNRASTFCRNCPIGRTEEYGIQARAQGNPGKDQMRLLMRSLLADRFKLTIHREDREVPVLAFVLIKPDNAGPKLIPHSEIVPCSTNSPANPTAATVSILPGGLAALCNGIFANPSETPGRIKLSARNVTLPFITGSLRAAPDLGRPMVDRTGLTVTFDFTLEFTPWNQAQAGAEPQ